MSMTIDVWTADERDEGYVIRICSKSGTYVYFLSDELDDAIPYQFCLVLNPSEALKTFMQKYRPDRAVSSLMLPVLGELWARHNAV